MTDRTLLMFDDLDGHPVLVRPEFIEAVRPNNDGKTVLFFKENMIAVDVPFDDAAKAVFGVVEEGIQECRLAVLRDENKELAAQVESLEDEAKELRAYAKEVTDRYEEMKDNAGEVPAQVLSESEEIEDLKEQVEILQKSNNSLSEANAKLRHSVSQFSQAAYQGIPR